MSVLGRFVEEQGTILAYGGVTVAALLVAALPSIWEPPAAALMDKCHAVCASAGVQSVTVDADDRPTCVCKKGPCP